MGVWNHAYFLVRYKHYVEIHVYIHHMCHICICMYICIYLYDCVYMYIYVNTYLHIDGSKSSLPRTRITESSDHLGCSRAQREPLG